MLRVGHLNILISALRFGLVNRHADSALWYLDFSNGGLIWGVNFRLIELGPEPSDFYIIPVKFDGSRFSFVLNSCRPVFGQPEGGLTRVHNRF